MEFSVSKGRQPTHTQLTHTQGLEIREDVEKSSVGTYDSIRASFLESSARKQAR
jgi:hypothetical protein